MPLGLIPSTEAVPQDAHRHAPAAIALMQEPGEGDHPQVAQLRSPPGRGGAAGLSPVQHQHDRPDPRRVHRPAILDPGCGFVHGFDARACPPKITVSPAASRRATGDLAGGSRFARSGCSTYLPAVLLLSTCGCWLGPATDNE